MNKLRAFSYMLSPDFSLFCDMPRAMQIYNHYRKHWLGAYYAMNGVVVIPTISWSDGDSYDWCFDGEPKESVVSVSTVGCCGNLEARRMFLSGYSEMVKRLRPVKVLCYGSEMADIRDEVDGIGYFAGEIRERVKAAHMPDEK